MWGLTVVVVLGVLGVMPSASADCPKASGYERRPGWVERLRAAGQRNEYFVGSGVGSELHLAYTAALQGALTEASLEEEVTIRSNLEIEHLLRTESGGGEKDEVQVREEVQLLTNRTIRGARVEAIHWERRCGRGEGGHEVFLLLAVPKARPDFSVPRPIEPMDGLWRSALLPGWGQLHKGDSSKGWTFLGTTLGSAAGGLLLNQMASNDYQDAAAARTRAEKNHFLDRGDAFRTSAILLFSTAGALYLYNLLDAALTEPRHQYYD